MANIRILPDIVVSRISAGEVIERPYSVVKELVENSIDANADRIIVELSSGGRTSITVSDNGSGMSRDNAIMSLERHATSKIGDTDDIFSLQTLGFRGEALPSIASVSRFVLTTRRKEDLSGTRIRVDGGKIKSVQDFGCPPGTSVEVKRLFFNTPARFKFMKTAETELGRTVDIIQREAVFRPEIAIEVINNKKRVLYLERKKEYIDRIKQILPGTELYEIIGENVGGKIRGYMGSPADSRSSMQKMYTYVNGRPVKDRFLNRLIIESYGKQLENKKFPQGVLFLKVPGDQLDVNVHPTKHEVRFRNPAAVTELVSRSVRNMLNCAPWVIHSRSGGRTADQYMKQNDIIKHSNNTLPLSEGSGSSVQVKPYPLSSDPSARGTTGKNSLPYRDNNSPYGSENLQHDIFRGKRYFSDLTIIGQLGNLYIICEYENGVVMVDQHAAHERVNYEKVRKNYYENMNYIQHLLIPEVCELSPSGYESYMIFRQEIEKLGFITEEFGGSSVRIKSVPALLNTGNYKGLFTDLVTEIEDMGVSRSINEKIDLIFATIACHKSVRANQKLEHKQIKALFSSLDEAESPFSCPHGRPVVIHMTYGYLESLFRRT